MKFANCLHDFSSLIILFKGLEDIVIMRKHVHFNIKKFNFTHIHMILSIFGIIYQCMLLMQLL